MKSSTLLFLVLSCNIFSSSVSISNSFIVSSSDSTKLSRSARNTPNSPIKPNIYAMHVQTNISNRFATTLVTTNVTNINNEPAETSFSILLPENAFISQFEMEIGRKIYKAYVDKKEEAWETYDQAVSQGLSAGHVELSARDSKKFTVSVNIEPRSETTFRLIYEELLSRQLGVYELVVNIHPQQIVDDLNVIVYINESRPLTLLRTPPLRTGNKITKNDYKLHPSADTEWVSESSAVVTFSPNPNQQRKFAQLLSGSNENGFAGQFIVQYDVERDFQGGEVLVDDGYFVHFFAPSELHPFDKHVVFVLDHSVSMRGSKIQQLIEAMKDIFSQLAPTDLFHIVRFGDHALVWNILQNTFNKVNLGSSPNYRNLQLIENLLKGRNLPQAVLATETNIQKAKKSISNIGRLYGTNIIAGLEVGLFLSRRTQEQFPKKYQPIIIFLTDGLPNGGIDSVDDIVTTVSKYNSDDNKALIFSLSLGDDADKGFLRKLASENLGFSQHVYEASDSALQLKDFYRKISTPLLRNVTFKYVDGVTEVTKVHYPMLFKGSELVVAGKTDGNSNVLQHVSATSRVGPIEFNAARKEPISSLERVWAYLTVQQMLKEREFATNKNDLTKKALNLALKYSFVTEVTSLVVTKPNKTEFINYKDVAANLVRNVSGGSDRSQSFPKVRLGDPLHFSISQRINSDPKEAVSIFSRGSFLADETPTWLEKLRNNNENITTSQGNFKIGNKGDISTKPPCTNAPENATGVCTILFDCPEVFSVLTDFNIYLKYFCSLNEFAGICCPNNNIVTEIS